MTHATDQPPTVTWQQLPTEPVTEPTISEAELVQAVNFLDDRYELTKREVHAIEHLLRTASARLDAPLLGGGR